MTILVYEEDRRFRDRLVELLHDGACTVVTPESFAEAADVALRQPFDVILCDYWMEEIDGLAFFQILKQQQPKAVKVLVAGYPIRATPSDIQGAGIHYVIPRPAVFKFLDMLKHTLAESPARPGQSAVH